ncbi:hypothetical protein GCM10007895_14630 [Paraferrimonas sedimenticola]|uniref:Uncharacterized protein n=1 Tax=Paraferrimonas sedimenticola TaxID=375674 RepID=A0AA37RX00_9GAMM|nr:hypothetical protein GCM10007895_14630 [Paraferrimonas sedimenticola]
MLVRCVLKMLPIATFGAQLVQNSVSNYLNFANIGIVIPKKVIHIRNIIET